MTRVALIADVHADLAALEIALAAIERSQVDAVWCLGDVVGRGRQHIDCLERVFDRCELVLLGNHDAYPLDPELHDPTLNDYGVSQLRPTLQALEGDPRWPAWRERLRLLGPQRYESPLLLIHASPADALWHHLLEPGEIFLIAQRLKPGTVVVHGHTHHQSFASYRDGKLLVARDDELAFLPGAEGDGPLVALDAAATLFLNPGSVGLSQRTAQPVEWAIMELVDGRPTSFEWRRELR